MITEHQEYITKEKHAELTKALKQLKTVDRKAIAEKLDYARGLGDLSENAEYHDAREQQSELEGKIEHIETILNTAEIVVAKKSDVVTIGSHVTIQNKATKSSADYQIVGSTEADMLTKKLSHEAPLGQALIGKKVGDTAEFKAPNGTITYTIKKLA
jgi:transcription elongation factor GreA